MDKNIPNFKVGDRVVWLGNGMQPDEHGVVTRIHPLRFGTYFKSDETGKEDWDYFEHFILEEIYDSPLYKALNEKEQRD
jgi:hypothetical protein